MQAPPGHPGAGVKKNFEHSHTDCIIPGSRKPMKKISKSELSMAENTGVVEYMERLARGAGIVHPDVVDRMKALSHRRDGTALCKYKNSIILKCNQTSSIVAAAFGTAYAIRTGEMFRTAVDHGAKTILQWSDGNALNLTETFGPDWVAGAWHRNEASWIGSINA